MIKDILILARPHQYTKNLFIFLPAFFAFKLQQPEVLWKSFISFCSFCFSASAVYILNDWKDRFEDAMHPAKKDRPIAAGRIDGKIAICTFGLFFSGGLFFAASISINVLLITFIYISINVLYSLKLKHISIIDIVIISIGFVLRLFAGAEATGVVLVNWIIVMTFLLAIFLALGKRRDDVLLFEKTNQKVRKVIEGYNLKFLDAAMVMTAAIVILAYIMWSISPEVASKHNSHHIYLTAIFVIVGILRYMQITFVEEKSGSPTEILLRDITIKMILVGWILSFVVIIYL
ncbi:UbiA prenyltransferase family protein [Desulfosarcina variabilis str. Montpellier]|uniref:UbiA prenyltransferase family protein n=1 Tax=Desulfosarcina variabilis TaxID=2300 RepID=UPI003AFB6022